MLVNLAKLAQSRAKEHKGLGAFNVVLIDHGEAFIDAAQAVNQPVVLQLSQNAVKYHGGRLRPLGKALLELAESATIPVVVHLDHAEDINLCFEAAELGFSSVMYDGSKLPDDKNRETTRKVVDVCHRSGVSVEAELGEVGGKNGVHDPSARTDPKDAATFVADTGVDLLAVAVGSSHAMATRDSVLDLDLISRIHHEVSVPLVLHGSSGVPDQGIRAAIKNGMTKINVSTHLNVIFTAKVRQILEDDASLVDPRKYCGPGNQEIRQETERLLRLYAEMG